MSSSTGVQLIAARPQPQFEEKLSRWLYSLFYRAARGMRKHDPSQTHKLIDISLKSAHLMLSLAQGCDVPTPLQFEHSGLDDGTMWDRDYLAHVNGFTSTRFGWYFMLSGLENGGEISAPDHKLLFESGFIADPQPRFPAFKRQRVARKRLSLSTWLSDLARVYDNDPKARDYPVLAGIREWIDTVSTARGVQALLDTLWLPNESYRIITTDDVPALYREVSSSCMTKNPHNALGFYVDNKTTVRAGSIVTTRRGKDLILGRVLLWRDFGYGNDPEKLKADAAAMFADDYTPPPLDANCRWHVDRIYLVEGVSADVNKIRGALSTDSVPVFNGDVPIGTTSGDITATNAAGGSPVKHSWWIPAQPRAFMPYFDTLRAFIYTPEEGAPDSVRNDKGSTIVDTNKYYMFTTAPDHVTLQLFPPRSRWLGRYASADNTWSLQDHVTMGRWKPGQVYFRGALYSPEECVGLVDGTPIPTQFAALSRILGGHVLADTHPRVTMADGTEDHVPFEDAVTCPLLGRALYRPETEQLLYPSEFGLNHTYSSTAMLTAAGWDITNFRLMGHPKVTHITAATREGTPHAMAEFVRLFNESGYQFDDNEAVIYTKAYYDEHIAPTVAAPQETEDVQQAAA